MTDSQSGGSGGREQQQPGGQGPGYHYEYNYSPNFNFNTGPSRPPKKDGGWGEWIGIIVLFLLPLGVTQVIAVIWAITKILKMSRRDRNYYYSQYRRTAEKIKREVEDVFRGDQDTGFTGQNQGFSGQQQAWQGQGASQTYTADGRQAWAAGPGQEPQAGPARDETKSAKKKSAKSTEKKAGSAREDQAKAQKAARKRADAEDNGSTGLIIGGAITAGIFGLGTASVLIEFLDTLFRGYFFSEDLVGVLACALFFAGGLAMLLAGIGGRNRRERYLNYLAYIGSNQEVSLAHMAATFGVSVRKLCKDLRRMLAKGILPLGYLDLAEGKLYLTEEGYRARSTQAPPPQQPQAEQPQPKQEQEQEDAILREIRQINDDIPDEVMSAKIARIEEITGKILAYQKSHPNREGQLRPFLNYYLPTTLKILRAYIQLESQGVEGENITAATQRIEGMMDQVVAGFEKQLDKLFQDDAMDIASDVQVLENMLKKDGLSDDNLTMTM